MFHRFVIPQTTSFAVVPRLIKLFNPVSEISIGECAAEFVVRETTYQESDIFLEVNTTFALEVFTVLGYKEV